jgi:hypothetical protein
MMTSVDVDILGRQIFDIFLEQFSILTTFFSRNVMFQHNTPLVVMFRPYLRRYGVSVVGTKTNVQTANRLPCQCCCDNQIGRNTAAMNTSQVRCFHSSHRTMSRYISSSNDAMKFESDKNWAADPISNQYKYWNPHNSKNHGQYSFLIDMSPESIVTEAKIISLSTTNDLANAALHSHNQQVGDTNHPPLPLGATLLSVGTTLEEIQSSMKHPSILPNVLFVSPSCPHAATILPQILNAYPSITWVHCRSAGIDFVESNELIQICTERNDAASTGSPVLHVTNAKGQFSSSLAEYALAACSYFAKDFPRLVQQQKAKQWINFDIQELYVFTRVSTVCVFFSFLSQPSVCSAHYISSRSRYVCG